MNHPPFNYKVRLFFTVLVLLSTYQLSAQTDGVLIDYTGNTRDNSAVLDVRSSAQGAMVPRMTEAQRDLINLPATSLLIYQTDNTPGYYYNSGTPGAPIWLRLVSDNTPLTGTGVTNYVTKWGSATSLTTAGNGALLGTSGTSSATRTLTLLENGDPQLNFGSYPGAWTSALQIQNNDNTDFVWISPLDNASNARIRTGGSGLDIYVGGANDAGTYSTTFAADGDVGIGVLDPTVKLRVAGDIESSNQIRATGWLTGTGTGQGTEIGVSSGYSYLMAYNRTAATYSPMRMVGSTIDLRHSDSSSDLFVDGTGKVGINNNSPNHQLDVVGNVNAKHILNGPLVARPQATWSEGGSTNGAIIIKLPGTAGTNYGMLHMEINLYEYGAAGVTTFIIGGHNWNNRWYNYNCHTIGNTTKKVRLVVKDGQYAVVIGEQGSTWSYGHVVLSKITNGNYYVNNMDLSGTYTVYRDNAAESWTWTSGDLNSNSNPSVATNYILNQSSTDQPANFRIDGNGLFNGGQVGIGTTSPQNDLHIHSTLTSAFTTSMRLSGTGTAVNGGNALFFKTSTNTTADRYGVKLGAIRSASNNGAAEFVVQMERTGLAGMEDVLRIDDQGDVGIGTTTPSSKLHINSTLSEDGIRINAVNYPEIMFQNGGTTRGYLGIAGNAGGYGTGSLAQSLILRSEGAGVHMITNGGTIALTANAADVGIGTTTPGARLHVSSTASETVRVQSSGSEADIHYINDNTTWQVGTNNSGNGTNSNQFYIYDSGYRLTVQKGTGDVGIGTITPSVKLQVEGDVLRTNTRVDGNERYPVAHSSGDDLLGIDPTWSNAELQAYFNNTNVAWNADATAPSGWSIKITGKVNVGGAYNSGFPYIPVEDGAKYYMECWIKQESGTAGHYMGSIDYDHNFSSLGGNPGSYGYWTMSNTTIGTSWTKVTGYITGYGNNVGQFETGTKYWTPMALFNYTGGGNCFLSGWKITKVSGGNSSSGKLTFTDTDTQIYSDQYIQIRYQASGDDIQIAAKTGHTGWWDITWWGETHEQNPDNEGDHGANDYNLTTSWTDIQASDIFTDEMPAYGGGIVIYVAKEDSDAYPLYEIRIIRHGTYMTALTKVYE